MKTKILTVLLFVFSVFVFSNSYAQNQEDYTDWDSKSLRRYVGIYEYWTTNQMGSGNKYYFYIIYTYNNGTLDIAVMDSQGGVEKNVKIESITGNVVKTNLFTGEFIYSISGYKGFIVTQGSYDDYFYEKTNSNAAKNRIKQIKAISNQ